MIGRVRFRWAWLCPLGLLAGCGGSGGGGRGPEPASGAALPVAGDWRRIATSGDRQRLRQWRPAWVDALARARRKDAAAIGAEGALFAFDNAVAGPLPPPGEYRCRVFKLGARTPGGADFVSYPWFACRIAEEDGGRLSLTKLTGSQRAVGTLFADDGMRAVFLGTLLLGDEKRPFSYGRDVSRDLAGWMERIGPARWRLALPYPAFESTLDVVELVPAA